MNEDGSRIQTPAEWADKRDRLRTEWHQLLGEWPELITNPQVGTLNTESADGYTIRTIRFLWTPTEKTTGYLLIPDEPGPHPAVLTVYYEPETAIGRGNELRDFAVQLTRRGFVTLSIGTTEATAAKTYSLYYPSLEKATVQPLSMLAYAAANAWYVLAA